MKARKLFVIGIVMSSVIMFATNIGWSAGTGFVGPLTRQICTGGYIEKWGCEDYILRRLDGPRNPSAALSTCKWACDYVKNTPGWNVGTCNNGCTRANQIDTSAADLKGDTGHPQRP